VEDVMSTMQAARELNLSHMTVLRLVQTGALRAYRKTNTPHSHIMVYVDSLEDFKAQRDLQEPQRHQGRPTAEIPQTATA